MKKLKETLIYSSIILMVILVRTFIITPVIVNGSSMEPTLLNKEILLLSKNNQNIERFDVVVLEINGERLVKRVVGLPGEHLKYINNHLYINHNMLEEQYLEKQTNNFNIDELGFSTIPYNSYFVLGDNRTSSKDSRFFGMINISQIIGKVKYRIFPINRLGKIK